jgi:ribosome recycling factor
MNTTKEIIADCEHRMTKAIEAFHNELNKIRTGRASTALLDTVKVDAYGTMMSLNQVANLSVPDAHTLAVQPWDRGMAGAIEKAIRDANLGLNPSSDGTTVRVPMPPLTEERRKEITKLVKKHGEESKIAIRNVRRDAMKHLEKAEADEHFSEDERKRGEDDIQKKTDLKVKDIDALVVAKEKEVMAV